VEASAQPGETRRKGHLTTPVQELPVDEMIERISDETDRERQWKLIEANLILGREERTYALVSRFGELIQDRTPHWPPARLKIAFGAMPGGVLISVIHRWSINQILTVADENPEQEKLLGYLRERELERLLELDVTRELITAEAARRDLGVDRNADPQMVKKVWRTLLGFLNADLGRQEERAIHRKKDEIAKYLQVARNILTRPK
jgi:hypothetical protein